MGAFRRNYRWIGYFIMAFVTLTIILDVTDAKTYSNLTVLGDNICVISGVSLLEPEESILSFRCC